MKTYTAWEKNKGGLKDKVISRVRLQLAIHICLIVSLAILSSFVEDHQEHVYEDLGRNSEIEDILETYVKAQAGQVKQIYEMGAPHTFLSQYFPTWKSDHNTYMIPPRLKESDSFSSRNLFDLLRQLGNVQKKGMFVIKGFSLNHVSKTKEEFCESIADTSGLKLTQVGADMGPVASEFMVFHHDIGIIHMEICDHKDTTDTCITDAVTILNRSENLINTLYQSADIFQTKVIALSSTKKESFLRIDYSILLEYDNVILLFAEDIKDDASFEKWWNKNFRDFPTLGSSGAYKEYEQILSYILMFRHLTPMTEDKHVWEIGSSLNSYTQQHSFTMPHNFGSKFPHILRWWLAIGKLGEAYSFPEITANSLMESFVSGLKANNDRPTLRALDNHLRANSFVFGNVPSQIDKIISLIVSEKHLISYSNIARFLKLMNKIYRITVSAGGKKLRPIKTNLNSLKSLNNLELKLSKESVFLEGEEPTDTDKELFKHLMCNFQIPNIHLPLVLNSEQLAVYEGPQKQLIIGGPGTGKTELLKAKTKELAKKIMVCEESVKILYIVATGSPSGDPLLSYQIKKYFSKYPPVEVLTIIIDQDHLIEMEQSKGLLIKKMDEETPDKKAKYQHVFIDEYWIGSKPKEHEIILKLISKIPGYVWISSVFDFHPDLIETSEKMIVRTKPLLNALSENHGVVSYLHQVARGANNIIELEKDYSSLYQGRKYPYGTKKMKGHSIEGFSVTWKKETDVSNMYRMSVEIVTKAVMGNTLSSSESLTLNAANILIVDFAVRSKESVNVTYTLKEQLFRAGFSVWSFGDSMEEFMDCQIGKLTLLSSRTRTESTYLDGVEWPMVVVILPSGVLLNKDSVATGAESLRNYDTYISFFRAQVKLVVISDKWTSNAEFLDDIASKTK